MLQAWSAIPVFCVRLSDIRGYGAVCGIIAIHHIPYLIATSREYARRSGFPELMLWFACGGLGFAAKSQ
jgi:hypothetical protein